MFSEYASRFLAQSNANLPFSANTSRNPSRNPLDRRRQPGTSRYVERRSPYMPNPPSSSQSRFPFASRLSRQDPQAPLFYSATDAFNDENQSEEHEREVADFYALQRSRQAFRPSGISESSDLDDDGIEKVEDGQRHDRDESVPRGRMGGSRTFAQRDQSVPESEMSAQSSKGKGRLVDVNLGSTVQEEDGPPESLANLSPTMARSEPDEDPPPPIQAFRKQQREQQKGTFLPTETDEEARIGMRPPSPDRESVPPTIILPAPQPPRHDQFWASIFQISLFAMFATFVLVWFNTSSPSSKNPLGDTLYTALRGSTSLLLWDTVISIVVALIWLALLRNYVRILVFTLLIALPVILTAFSLYPLVSSYKGSYNGGSIQDKAMRWLSAIPAIVAVVWTVSVVRSRHSLGKAISILEFSTRILGSSQHLVTLGFATLALVVIFTWTWMLMFERIFLSGHFSGAKKFLLDANSWWLGAFFILQYLWSLGVIAGMQRATTAATVSQWYFHRLTVPQPTSQAIVKASLQHATAALLGTICLSTFLSLLIRLPLIILPRRLAALLSLCAYSLIPTSLATLTNPLTLTYAAIHSQPLGISARGLAQLHLVSLSSPSTTASPRNFSPQHGSTLIPYRLAKHLLHATRFIMSAALGVSGWVHTARSLAIDDGGVGVRGSLYAYVVGLIAGTIGFAVLGAVEGVVGGVVDAAVVCWASETGGGRGGEARFCREAGDLFGEEEF